MANKVTQDDILRMNELYVDLHTYAAVARETGFSPSTVKKYIVDGFQKSENMEIIPWNGIIQEPGTYYIDKNLSFSLEEQEKLEQLRKEISI